MTYKYVNNVIKAQEVSDLKDETIVETAQKIFNKISRRERTQTTIECDRQSGGETIKGFFKTKECKWQFVKPQNHRVTATKRAIHMFKNHLIGGFWCTYSECLLQLWNNLIKQALITLTLCRTNRKHPNRSAYHPFYGKYCDWNKHLIEPPGTRAVVYEAPEGRLSWGTRGVDG